MSLADNHSHETMVCIHNVDVKVICGRQTMHGSVTLTGAEMWTYNSWVDNG